MFTFMLEMTSKSQFIKHNVDAYDFNKIGNLCSSNKSGNKVEVGENIFSHGFDDTCIRMLWFMSGCLPKA